MLHRCAGLIILATVAAWPTAGWSRAARHACDIRAVVPQLLQNWARQLSQSTPARPEPILSTYADNAVLVPTCKNGPLSGRDDEIKKYFVDFFLKPGPKVEFNTASIKIGGTCLDPFASGLYTFTLDGDNGRKLDARYTYIFQQNPTGWLIVQHHSSLEPESNSACPD
jgi:hypothetical protein